MRLEALEDRLAAHRVERRGLRRRRRRRRGRRQVEARAALEEQPVARVDLLGGEVRLAVLVDVGPQVRARGRGEEHEDGEEDRADHGPDSSQDRTPRRPTGSSDGRATPFIIRYRISIRLLIAAARSPSLKPSS